MTEEIIRALKGDNENLAKESLKREAEIVHLCEAFREENTKRVKEGICSVSAVVYFLDFLTKFEDIGGHLTNIAHGVRASKKRH